MPRLALRNPFTGKRLSITRPTREAAEEIRSRVLRVFQDMRDGHLGVAEGHDRVEQILSGRVRPLCVDTLFDDYLATLSARERKRLQAHWSLHMFPAFGGKHPLQMNETVMGAWYRTLLDAGNSGGYAQKLYEEIQASINLAVRVGKLPLLPWHGWRPKKAPKPERGAAANVDEIMRVLAAARELDILAERSGAIGDLSVRLELLFTCGVRQGEAAALGWDHIVWTGDFPHVFIEYQTLDRWRAEHPEWTRPKSPTKGREEKRVALSPETLAMLDAHQLRLGRLGGYDAHGPVFPSRPDRPEWRALPRVVPSEVVRKCVTMAGIANPEKWVTHSTRHSFVSIMGRKLAKEGRNVKEIMQAVGHKDLRQLAGYTHADGEAPIGLGVPRAASPVEDERVLYPDFTAPRATPEPDESTTIAPALPLSDAAKAEAERLYHRTYSRIFREKGDAASARLGATRARRGFEARQAGLARGRTTG